MVDSLATVARELYALDPGEFTAARNAAARELKPVDAGLAGAVSALRKPSPAAWAGNLLAREHADRLDTLLELGERMRQAQQNLDRAELGRLGAERRATVAALTRDGAELAAAHGRPLAAGVLTELEQTLQAATSDATAGAAVASGLLVRAIRAVGFEPVELDGAVAVPEALGEPRAPSRGGSATGAPSPVRLADARRRKEARQEADRLERDADAAAADLDALERRDHRLQLRRTNLEAEIAELREQLLTAEQALTSVRDEASTLAEDHAQAERDLAEARRRAHDARTVADSLDTSH